MQNNPLTDPHIDPYASLNLEDDFYSLFKVHMRSLRIADQIVEIVRTGLVAAIPLLSLNEMGWAIAAEAGMNHAYLQKHTHYWWSALSLSMMTHCSFEEFKEDGVVRFTLSKYDNEPLYRENVEWVQDKNTKHKKLMPKQRIAKLPDYPIQASLF